MQIYIISSIVAVLIFIVVLALNQLYIINRKKQFEKTLKQLKRDEGINSYPESQYSSTFLKNTLYNFLDKIRTSIKTASNNKVLQAKQKFEKCGWDSEYAEIITPIANILLIIGFIGIFFILYFTTPYFYKMNMIILTTIFIIFVFVGFRSYEYIIDFYASIRIKNLVSDLPMVIDLMSICAEAGLTFDRSLEKIAQEIIYSNYSLSRELSITAAELSILPDRRSAYNNMFKRMPVDIVRALSISMIYAEQHGVSVSKTLNSLAEENTKKAFYLIEIKAGKIPAKMTVPIILFSIPIIGIIILGQSISKLSTANILG